MDKSTAIKKPIYDSKMVLLDADQMAIITQALYSLGQYNINDEIHRRCANLIGYLASGGEAPDGQ